MTIHTSFDSLSNRLKHHADNIEKNASKKVRVAALQSLSFLVTATPVDSGRLRSNMHVSIDSTTGQKIYEASAQKGADIQSRESSEISKYKPGQTLYIQNNLQYAQKINSGGSKKAGKYFMQRAVQNGIKSTRGVTLLGNIS